MKLPQRIQRKRTKGWKQPKLTCYCGRGSKWGNPFAVELWGLDKSLRMYKDYLNTCVETGTLDLTELLKYDYLSCWCPLDQKCHVDILISKLKERNN